MLVRSLTVILISFKSFVLFGQDPIVISDLQLVTSGSSVVFSWTIEAGSTCNGVEILRADKSQVFNVIGEISGVCGNPEISTSYLFTDQNPLKNEINYYQIRAGSVQLSEIKQIDFVSVENNKYIIKYNAELNTSRIYFVNKSNANTSIVYYNVLGEQLLSDKALENFYEINNTSFVKGTIYFKIVDMEGLPLVQGSLVNF